MKKLSTFIAIVIVLIAAWLGAAWYTGTHLEARTGDVIGRLNAAWARNPQTRGTQIKQIDYERGLLSSHARFAVVSSLLSDEPLAEIDLTFSHGPFPLAALQRGNFLPLQFQTHIEVLATAGPLKMMAGALMNGKPPLVMDFGCSYGNHCTGTGGVPPINVDPGRISRKAKLAFGGIQMQFDYALRSDTDYTASADAQLLPLSIGGQNFGSGQVTANGDPQSFTEVISWKTDQGASKFTFVGALTQPIPFGRAGSIKPEDWAKLIKTVSAKLELSKPMVVDLAARALSLTKDIDLDTAREQVSAELNSTLTGNPNAEKFIHAQSDLLISDWQYAADKLTVNGEEQPELLEQFKRSYQEAQQRIGGENNDAADAATPASAPDAAASDQ